MAMAMATAAEAPSSVSGFAILTTSFGVYISLLFFLMMKKGVKKTIFVFVNVYEVSIWHRLLSR